MDKSLKFFAGRGGYFSNPAFQAAFKKLILLFALSAVTTVLYFPSLTFFGFSYQAGDVAELNIKSPVEVRAGDLTIRKGEVIVREGQIIAEGDLGKFALIESAVRSKKSVAPIAGFFAFTSLFILITYLFAAGNIRKFSTQTKDLLLMAVIFLGVVILLRFSDLVAIIMKQAIPAVPSSVYKFMIPVAVGPMLVRLLLNSETALVFAALSSFMAGYFMGGNLEIAAFTLVGGAAAAMGVRRCTHRSIVLRAGIILGVVNAAALISIAALKGSITLKEPVFLVIAGLSNGLVTAILAIGIAPLFESAFQYTTNIKLLELSRMDHPLLKELAMRAPGTHHHSIVIGTLVEAAAESISANPLLARVGAYYHDIGKLKMPHYFIENTNGENKHDRLAPSMSTLVLTNHIKEGVELARKYRLGSEITDIISQHHGTSLVSFFYQKAKAMEASSGCEVEEKDYRYPGPKPQTKEAGIVMLADAIEAASKTLTDPTPEKVEWLTQKIVNKIFADGQLDECELTLKDLHSIMNSFNRVLAGVYHQRISYPETDARQEEGFEGSDFGRDKVKGFGPPGKEDDKGRVKRIGPKRA